MASTRLFRKEVLDRLASPEQLHRLMRVTDPRGWLALAGCGLLVATGAFWSVTGSIPTKVPASGILLHSAGLADAVALAPGQVTSLEVDVGDHVREGQVIARVAQPELVKQLEALRAQAGELEAMFEKSQRMGSQDVELRSAMSAQAQASLRASISALGQRRGELSARLESQQKLYKRGLVTREAVSETRDQLRSAKAEVAQLRAEMERVSAESFSAKRQTETSLEADKLRLAETEREIELLEQRLDKTEKVVSSHAGRVVEVRVSVGDLLGGGEPIVSMERTGQAGGLEAVLYLDSREGKRIHPGMTVHVSPAVVRPERHGMLIATVTAVDDFPSTRRGMMRVLRNDQLVDAFLAETAGAPIAVRAKLQEDSAAPTGYRWTSGTGPELDLTSGTRCTADITIRSQRPISLLLPTLDEGE